MADPAITLVARQQFVAWQAGKLHKELYSDSIQSKLTDAKVDDTSRALGTLGPLKNTVFMGPFIAPDIPEDAHGYIYQMQCDAGNVYEWLVINGQGKIATIFFKDKLETDTIEATPAANVPPPPPPR